MLSLDAKWEWVATADRANITVLHLVTEGSSQVHSISFDGNVISGTATFIDAVEFRNAWSNNTPYPGSVAGGRLSRTGDRPIKGSKGFRTGSVVESSFRSCLRHFHIRREQSTRQKSREKAAHVCAA